MANRKPTLVFCPGGWHSPECFDPVVTILSQEGYKIDKVAFPTIGAETRGEAPHQDWNADVDCIRQTVLDHLDQGEDVVLIVHSYSGAVGSEALEGLDRESRQQDGKKGGVIHLVYLAALVLPIGGYIWQSTGGKPYSPRIKMDGDLCYATDTYQWFYNECGEEKAKLLESQLHSHSWKAFLSPVTYHAWRKIPSTYLLCEKDQALPLELQRAMVESAEGCFEVETCDADHSPFQSRPARTAEVIRKAAGDDFLRLLP